MRLAIKVRGEMVRQGLENIHQEIPAVGRRRMRTIANRVVRRMQEYPAERPGQDYTRTGTLFRRWMIKEINKIGYSIQNLTPYTHYVVGDAFGTSQAWMHKGRWQRFRDVTDEELLKLPDEIMNEIVMVARREEFEVT